MDIQEKYKRARPDIKSGDVIVFEKKGILPTLIKFFDSAKFTHVGIVWEVMIGEKISLFIIDSNEPGVNPDFLSDRINVSLDFAVIRPLDAAEEINGALNFIMEKAQTGIKYNNLRLLRIAIAKKLGWDIKKLDGKGCICSQFVQLYTDELNISCYSKDPLITPQGFINEADPKEVKILFDI